MSEEKQEEPKKFEINLSDEMNSMLESTEKAKSKIKKLVDPERCFQKSLHHITEKMRNEFTLDGTFPQLREKYGVTKKDFNKAKDFVFQRATRGWANRDTWGIDHWFSATMSNMLEYFAGSTHGYPDNSLELYEKCKEFDLPDADAPDPQGKDESLDDYKFRIYQFIIRRMAFLFREYREETCSVQNNEKFIHKTHSEKIPGQPFWRLVDDCNEEEKAQNKKWMDRENEVDLYRYDCLHRGLKMFEIMIQCLWD